MLSLCYEVHVRVLKVHMSYFSFRKKCMIKDLIQLNNSSHSHFRDLNPFIRNIDLYEVEFIGNS